MSDSANPLVAVRQDSTGAFSGVFIAEDIDALVAGYNGGGWIDTAIGGFAASMDTLAFVTDPLGQLVMWGVGWLIEHVKPLSDALDDLAGDPDQIAAYARTWRNVAGAVGEAGDDLRGAVTRQLAGWAGSASDAYRRHAGEHEAVLQGLAKASTAMAEITTGAGLLVAMVRGLVRDLIAEFVSVLAVRLWEWLAEAGLTLGLATPWVIAQVTALASKWIARITRLLHGLIDSLRRLTPILRRLDDLIQSLKNILRRASRSSGPVPAHGQGIASRGTGPFSKNAPRTNRDVLDNGPGTPRMLENVRSIANRMGLDLNDVDVVLVGDPEEIRYLDFMGACAYTPSELNGQQIRLGPASFADEDTLAATIAHEHTHVVQQRGGEHLQRPLQDLEDEAYASEGPALSRLRGESP